MTAQTRDWMTELMADASWTRRLASALLGDASAGDDVVQDAWMKTGGQRPPGVADRQGWIRTVLANALRNRRRGERRRLARERASASAPAAVATPEELLGRLEMHRKLAALVSALPEPGRNVLLLHYFEGLTSAQIAAATGAPPGTVRWRLKTALDELRAGLDAELGAEKKDWRRALAPLLGGAPGSGRADAVAGFPVAGPWLVRAAVALALLLGAVAAVFLVARWSWGPREPGGDTLARSTGEVGAAAGPGAAPGPGARGLAGRVGPAGGRRPVAIAGAAIARPCDGEIRALETDLVAARAALAYHLPPRNVWSEAKESGRNLTAQQAIEPAVARWLDDKGAPRAGRSIDCRHDACVVAVLEPWPPAPPWVHRSPGPATQAALEAQARDIELDGPKRVRRALGPEEAETQIWFRLHAPSGAAGQAAPLPLPRALLPSAALRSGRPTEEGAQTAECRARKEALEGELESLRRRSVSLISAPLLFRTEPPNPALAATLQAPLDRFVRARQALSGDDRTPPLRVECRGRVCRVTGAEGATMPESVLGPLLKDEGFAGHVRRSSARSRNGRIEDGLYITVLPPPSETTSGEDVLRHFLQQWRRDPAGERCKQRFPPAGSLSLRFVLPATGEVNEDGVPERISFRLGGPVAESAFGRCLAETLAQHAAAFVPPSGISRAEMSKTVELPD